MSSNKRCCHRSQAKVPKDSRQKCGVRRIRRRKRWNPKWLFSGEPEDSGRSPSKYSLVGFELRDLSRAHTQLKAAVASRGREVNRQELVNLSARPPDVTWRLATPGSGFASFLLRV